MARDGWNEYMGYHDSNPDLEAAYDGNRIVPPGGIFEAIPEPSNTENRQHQKFGSKAMYSDDD